MKPEVLHEKLLIRPVRRGSLKDAAGVAAVLESVIAEGGLTVLTGRWTPEDELKFISGLGLRDEMYIAQVQRQVLGFQIIQPFASFASTMDHVATVGTYVQADARGLGIGRRLAGRTFGFAREQGFEKIVVYVLAENSTGRAYYRGLGFVERGVLEGQAKVDGVYLDEVIMEHHFDAHAPINAIPSGDLS